jgi:cytochrome b561
MVAIAVVQPAQLRYDANTIALHWVTAVLVVLMWVSGQTIDWLGHDWSQLLRSIHICIGLTLAVVLGVRLVWRVTSGRSLPDADPGLMQTVARMTHYLLYVVACGTVALGVTSAWVRGDTVFGLVSFPGGWSRPTAHDVLDYHSLAANAILIVAGCHAAAALFHHYVLRDGVLRRMLPPN